jgi:hypothetical protein
MWRRLPGLRGAAFLSAARIYVKEVGGLRREPTPVMSTIPCDFCPHPVDRNQMEEIEISHYVPDSSGDDLAYARTYFFGHPDCVRKFYRTLVDHKLDLFKHIPSAGTSAGPSPE